MASKRILLLIPDALQRDLAGLALQRAGFEVVLARESAELPDLLARHQPAALLLDLFLPGVNGLDVLEQLQAEVLWGKRVCSLFRGWHFPKWCCAPANWGWLISSSSLWMPTH